jgi:putative PIN family toxin of toxin-antitoxin system
VLIEKMRAGELTMVSSPALMAELGDVIARPTFSAIMERCNVDPGWLLTELRGLAEIVDPPPLSKPVGRDRDDDAVLALAVAMQPALIISGDADLLVLRAHAGVPIVTPARAIEMMTISND